MSPDTERMVKNGPADKSLGRTSFPELAQRLAMFGQEYVVDHEGITLQGQKAPESHMAVIREYLASSGRGLIINPWRGIGSFSGGSAAVFRERVELPLAHHATEFSARAKMVLPLVDGELSASMIGSDVAFVVRALPNIYLHVELSEENREFPAEAWVLFSNNADNFLSLRGLHQIAELFKERLLGLLRIY